MSAVRLIITAIVLLFLMLVIADKYPNYAVAFMLLVLLGVTLSNADIIAKIGNNS